MDERIKTIDSIVRNQAAGEQWAWAAVAAAYDAGQAAERERWRGLVQAALDADEGDHVLGKGLADRMRAALGA